MLFKWIGGGLLLLLGGCGGAHLADCVPDTTQAVKATPCFQTVYNVSTMTRHEQIVIRDAQGVLHRQEVQ